jgi:hypothetical protein
MTPEQFAAWVGGGGTLMWLLLKGGAFVAETFGLRPIDKRAERDKRLAECEDEIGRLQARIVVLEAEVAILEREVKQECDRADFLERVLRRAGFQVDGNGSVTKENNP